MNETQRNALIENYKNTVSLTASDSMFFQTEKDYARIEAKEEIMNLFFTPTEILRFKNEARVQDNEKTIAILEEFQTLLNKAVRHAGFENDNPLIWDKKSISEVVYLYSRKLEDEEERKRFEELGEIALVKLVK